MMKKINCYIITAVIILTQVLCFSSCKADLREKDLEEIIPKEIIEYRYDSAEYQSTNKMLHIINRIRENNTESIDCEIYLQDNNLYRIAYIRFICDYVGKNGYSNSIGDGWILRSWEPWSPEIVTAWSPTQDIADRTLNDCGYQSLDCHSMGVEGNESKYTYSVEKALENISVHGDVSVKLSLKCDNDMKYPMAYHINAEIDTSELLTQWDLEGTWYGDVGNYKITMEIVSVTDKRIWWKGTAKYNTIDGSEDSYVSELHDSFYSIDGNSLDDMVLTLEGVIVYPCIMVKFYPNKAEIGEGYLWGTDGPDTYYSFKRID